MKNNKTKAFSLIEIVQTVVLLGIIAGLSVSFFKKVNTDDKIKEATEVQLFEALQEANNQMCSDETPYCQGTYQDGGSNISYGYEVTAINSCCSADYTSDDGKSASFNPNTGFCEVEDSNHATNCYSIVGMKYDSDRQVCYAPPKCHGGSGNNANGNVAVSCQAGNVLQDNGSDIKAKALHEIVCENNIPVWTNPTKRIIGGHSINPGANTEVTEICYRLWSLVNHDRRGMSEYDDLNATCMGTAATTINCMITRRCDGSNNPANIPAPSMLLPNGAAIYNLNCLAKINCPSTVDTKDAQNLYIKVDRNNANIDTFNDTTTSLFNAIYLSPNNNILPDTTDSNIITIKNNNGGDKNAFNIGNETPYSPMLQKLYRKANPQSTQGGTSGETGGQTSEGVQTTQTGDTTQTGGEETTR